MTFEGRWQLNTDQVTVQMNILDRKVLTFKANDRLAEVITVLFDSTVSENQKNASKKLTQSHANTRANKQDCKF